MRRIFAGSNSITDKEIKISDKGKIHHVRDVLRIKEGQILCVFDEKENEYTAVAEKISSSEILLAIKEKKNATPDKNMRLTIACAIPKKAKIDDIIDKLTQLGVHRIIPMQTDRVVVKLDKAKERARHERWLKIGKSASEQCQRNTLPIIDPVKTMKEVLREAQGFDLKLIPTLALEKKPLKDAIEGSKYKDILVLIGPEGDFSDGEIAMAMKAGFVPVSLGELVLRVDTAAVAVASFIELYANY